VFVALYLGEIIFILSFKDSRIVLGELTGSIEELVRMSEPESESLFERLQKTFPVENMPPYGSVLVIPSKVFNPQWEEKLKNEGVKVYSSGFHGEAVFLVRKADRPVAVSEDKPSDRKPKFWTSEEKNKLRELYSEGVSCSEIAEQLGRTKNAVYKKAFKMHLKSPVQQLQKKPVPLKARPQVLIHETRLEDKVKPEPRPTSNPADDEVVKEFLAAAQRLYPEFPRACAYLLQLASNRILKIE
jgi:transposase-like protein